MPFLESELLEDPVDELFDEALTHLPYGTALGVLDRSVVQEANDRQVSLSYTAGEINLVKP